MTISTIVTTTISNNNPPRKRGADEDMSMYTYDRDYAAHTMSGQIVTIPDQVAADQHEYDGKTFPVIRDDGRKARAMLMGDEYGLHTTGTGEPVVRMI